MPASPQPAPNLHAQPDPREPAATRAVEQLAPHAFALWGIFTLLLFYTLYAARSLLLPVLLAALASLALAPVVRGLGRLRVPRPLAAVLILGGLVALGVGALRLVAEPAMDWATRAPSLTRDVESKLRSLKEPIAQVTEATESMEEATQVVDPAPEVEVRKPSLADRLFVGTQTLLATLGVALVLTYFFLAAGDRLPAKLARALRLARNDRRALDLVRAAERDMSRYLLTVSIINAVLGASVAGALYLLGMPNPLLWGALTAALNFVPYLGPLVTGAVIAAVAILSFDDVSRALTVTLAFFAITGLEGWVLTPLLVGRRLLLSPVAVLLGVLLWTWLWGIPGTLVAMPSLVVLKIVCDRTPRLRPLGELMAP